MILLFLFHHTSECVVGGFVHQLTLPFGLNWESPAYSDLGKPVPPTQKTYSLLIPFHWIPAEEKQEIQDPSP